MDDHLGYEKSERIIPLQGFPLYGFYNIYEFDTEK